MEMDTKAAGNAFEPQARPTEPDPGKLQKIEASKVISAAKFWVPRAIAAFHARKERLKSFAQSLERTSLEVGRNLRHVRQRLPAQGERSLLVQERYGLARFVVGVDPLLQCRVIELSLLLKNTSQRSMLRARRPKPVPIRKHQRHWQIIS